MPGVVFLIVVPTANFERELIYGSGHNVPPPHQVGGVGGGGGGGGGNNNLNINLPENNNAILRLEVELRDKHAPKYRRGMSPARAAGMARGGGGIGGAAVGGGAGKRGGGAAGGGGGGAAGARTIDNRSNLVVPLEKVLEELLIKLEIEHVTWTTSKKGYFHHVVFPLQSGEPCETTLHCLTELGIGTKLNSSVSVLPCSVSYDALTDPAAALKDSFSESSEDFSKWNNFVESIKSKLTVKQVVDGVRAGGSLSFDYLLLIVTADSLAALGLVENNAPNIVAAMLVSPLMGPVMSITFGTIISDRELMRVGFICLALGMFISCLFGFIFGLILGTTEMPWGGNDWPTEEMRGRGNVRSLWMGVLWALTSGTGVAVALLQGSAGPLIGVAISASLLPPVVNCGLFWALACIWQIYPEKRMLHLKGEAYNETSAYPFLYTDYLPTEFFINGIVSACLTVVNVICIFITAIIVLKIKEVSAPYTASPDLKRFWETDLRTVRKTNRSTMRRGGGGGGAGGRGVAMGDKLLNGYQGLDEPHNRELDSALERALKEAEDDATFKKVKRMSYSSNAAGELTQRLAKIAGLNKRQPEMGSMTNLGAVGGGGGGSHAGSRMNSISNSKLDLKALDKLVSSLLEQHSAKPSHGGGGHHMESPAAVRKGSAKLNRWRPTSRSAQSYKHGGGGDEFNLGMLGGGGGGGVGIHTGSFNQLQEHSGAGGMPHTSIMPTIMESGLGVGNRNQHAASSSAAAAAATTTTNNNNNNNSNPNISTWPSAPGAVRNVLHRLSQNIGGLGSAADADADSNEENLNLTQNYVA